MTWARKDVEEVTDSEGHQTIVPNPEIPQEAKSQNPSSLAILDKTVENWKIDDGAQSERDEG